MLLASRGEETESEDYAILGDPGAVSRVGRKGGTKVFMYGRKSPWVPTLADSSGWRLQIGHKKCFVLLCPIGEQLSSFREFVHDRYCLATLARFLHHCACKGNLYFLLSYPETKGLQMSRKNLWDAISRSN